MTVIDPFAEAAFTPGGPVREEREFVMLRHDVRGALQSVIAGLGGIDLAALPAATREQVERVAAAARSLASLVGAVLGDTPDRPDGSAVDVGAFLEHIQRRHAADARTRGLALRIEADAAAPASLRLDRTALARIIDNLVGNAIRFTEAGTVRLAVGRASDGSVEFRVTDDGPGMSPEALAQVLRYGYRPGGSGDGLGLHIVKSLAGRLGGEVALANRPSGGLEALVRFPAEVSHDAGEAPPAFVRGDLSGIRVLLAEDNPTNQMVASQMLQALNAEVTVCADGVEALERFEQQDVDLVVVDIEMPRLSGLDVIRAIRARGDARAQVPIVALTAYAMREHRERIAAAGANGLISKPITSVEDLGRGLAVYVTARRSGGPAADPAGLDEGGRLVDVATFEALCEAIGAETMAELLDKVVADLLGAQRELAAALPGLDRDPIRSASHILISVAGALGAVRLQACARALNAAAHGDDRAPIEAGVRRTIAEIDAAVAFARARRAER